MNVLKGMSVAALLLAGATLALPARAWEPCMLTRTEFGAWSSNCTLEELFKHHLLVSYMPPPCRLSNLELKDIEYYVIGRSVEVAVEVVNRGDARARAHEVEVSYVLSDPASGQWLDSGVVELASAGLAPGARETHYVASLYVPAGMQRADVNVFAVADPTSEELPGGEVWECNEQDNTQGGFCAWYEEGVEVGPDDPAPCH